MVLNSNASEILAIFERVFKQRGAILETKCINNVLKNKAHFCFPLKHLENEILTEPQPKKAKLLCCIRKAKLFFLILTGVQINKSSFLVSPETPGE